MVFLVGILWRVLMCGADAAKSSGRRPLAVALVGLAGATQVLLIRAVVADPTVCVALAYGAGWAAGSAAIQYGPGLWRRS